MNLAALLLVLAAVAVVLILVAIPLWLVGQFLMWRSGLTSEEISRL